MTNLDSILKSRDTTLPTKVHTVKAMVFLVVTYGWEGWNLSILVIFNVVFKISRRNINNLRYADDTTPMAESEKELKSLLMKVKDKSGKAGLKLHIQKTKILESSPITSWQIDGETMETVTDFGLQNHCSW